MTSAEPNVPQPASGLPDGSEPSLSVKADGMHVEGTPAGSPEAELAHLINHWHLRSLASARLTASDVRKWLVSTGLLLDEQEREVGQQGIPATGGERCERCGRRLQFIHRVNGSNYGRICATKAQRSREGSR